MSATLAVGVPRVSAMRATAGDGLVYILGAAGQAVAGALTLPLAAWFLTPAQYGTVALVLIIALLFNVLAMAGLPTAAMRLNFDAGVGPLQVRSLYAPAVLIAITMALLAGLALALIQLSVGLPAGLWPALVILPWLTLPAALTSLSATILQAERRPRPCALIAVLRGGLNTAAGVLAVILWGATPLTYLIGYGAGGCLIAAVAVTYARPRIAWPAPGVLRRALRIGLPTVGAAVGVSALAMADRLVVGALRAPAAVGRYQLAYAIGSIVFTVLTAINAAWIPQVLAAPDGPRRIAAVRQVGRPIQALALLLAAGCALLGPLVLPWLLPASYHPRALAPLAALVALGAAVYVPYMGASQLLLHHERTLSMSWIVPVAVLVEVLAGFALVPGVGLAGAALASDLAYVAQCVLAIMAAAAVAGRGWLSRSWVLASLPGLAGWILGMTLGSSAPALALRAVAAVLLGLVWLGGLRRAMSLRSPVRAAGAPA